jgi:hypothetical protein
MNKTTDQINDELLRLFYVQSAQIGKPLPHAAQWDEHKKKQEAAYWESQRNAHETLCSLFRGDHLNKMDFKK